MVINTIIVVPEAEPADEELAEELRRSARVWRSRFANVDFVNLPRVAMLAAGGPVMSVARSAGLDVTRPFHGQGMAPGTFVGKVRPLFDAWDAEAVVLDETTVGKMRGGVLVSFEASMRCVNPPAAPPQPPSGNLARDPHLVFSVGGQSVIVSFDPQWLTTATAGTTLHDAAEEPQVYSGLGRVASVSADGRVRISALVFGQPQTTEQALWNLLTSRRTMPRVLDVADVRNAPPPVAEVPLRAVETVERLEVAFFFDEGRDMPPHIDLAVLTRVARTVPEYRRDLEVTVASLLPPDGTDATDATEVAEGILLGNPVRGGMPKVEELAGQINCGSLAVATVTNLTRAQAADLDAVMPGADVSYLGCVELDRNLAMHRLLFPEQEHYRVDGTELLLLDSVTERYGADSYGDDLEAVMEGLRDQGVYRSVVRVYDQPHTPLSEVFMEELWPGPPS
ncbi:hypothetical protein BJF79_13975 [Actinomadura sp. CNU-125]|nr:hypothetical protein BJF79_13975 [Actinomadura sp. CNU-125]